MSNLQSSWPEPIVRVQALSESGLSSIPERYIKPPSDRPSRKQGTFGEVNIPVIDLLGVMGKAEEEAVGRACREWGFFQVVNHGVNPELMRAAREGWREFFHLPMELKQPYANSPCTYEGYGSRLGVEKGAILDWSDYFFLHFLPPNLRDPAKWPSLPPHFRYVYVPTLNIYLLCAPFEIFITCTMHFIYKWILHITYIAISLL